MRKYTVYLVTTAEHVVEVEAEDGEDAIEKAFETSLPYAPHNAGFSIGDWTHSSELYGTPPSEDYEEID